MVSPAKCGPIEAVIQMYLKRLFVENNGPIRQATIEPAFTQAGQPKPLVLVGGNGTGKTTILSAIADALFEAAAAHYEDSVRGTIPGRRPWFRIIGPNTISVGATGGCFLMEFFHNERIFLYHEKGGTLEKDKLATRAPEAFKDIVNWDDKVASKSFVIESQEAERIFEAGSYVFFPASRNELPHWLNVEAIREDRFDLSQRFQKRVRKPLFVERSLDLLKQWILGLITDVRIDASIIPSEKGLQFFPHGPFQIHLQTQPVLEQLCAILQIILGDEHVRFGWGGRNASTRLVIMRTGATVTPILEGLSAGQSSLLGIFGTLLRYGDLSGDTAPHLAQGICLIDEIDAHAHVNLQSKALPKLMKMFPNIQFVVTSHSPLFLLGLERVFGDDGVKIIELPDATPVHAEKFREFENALSVFGDTDAFKLAIKNAVSEEGPLLVLMEGETDPRYMEAAAKALGRIEILAHVKFAWVGHYDTQGNAKNTGKDALNAAVKLLLATPEISSRPVLMLYDSDTNKSAENHPKLFIRCLPKNTLNSKMVKGIENLLSASLFTDDMYEDRISGENTGERIVRTSLKKIKLCDHVCVDIPDASHFVAFGSVLDMVQDVIARVTRNSAPEDKENLRENSPDS
jgi:hypothetical protein